MGARRSEAIALIRHREVWRALRLSFRSTARRNGRRARQSSTPTHRRERVHSQVGSFRVRKVLHLGPALTIHIIHSDFALFLIWASRHFVNPAIKTPHAKTQSRKEEVAAYLCAFASLREILVFVLILWFPEGEYHEPERTHRFRSDYFDEG